MIQKLWRHARSQEGFTLVELIITSLLTLIVMTGLTSVVFTTMKGNDFASGRIEASGQIRNFQLCAYDDFALSSLPNHPGCAATQALPCSTPIALSGSRVANLDVQAPVPSAYPVTYSWVGTAAECPLPLMPPCLLDRAIPGSSSHIATSVTHFSWYLDGRTVVVTLTVQARSYSETQALRFYPRVN